MWLTLLHFYLVAYLCMHVNFNFLVSVVTFLLISLNIFGPFSTSG